MKQLLTSMKDVAVSRLKNPILGAFAFCWMTLNIKGVSLFFLSSTVEKKTIVTNWTPTLIDDLVYPSLLTLGYLLVLPWFHLLYQAIDEGVITKFRQSIKNKTLARFYRELRVVNEQKFDSNEEYIGKLKEANVTNWPEEKKRMTAIVNREREKYSKKINYLTEIEKRVLPKLEENEKFQVMLKDYSSALIFLGRALTESELSADNGSQEVATHLKLIHKDLDRLLKGETFEFQILKEYRDQGIFIYQPNFQNEKSTENT
ncbi:hypothetical protein [Vibrio chagasii]|uniref:hypothetical protein n=1 Tax=Vibrio chagasii TaxID=170679 RepID=UPI004068292A